MWYKELATFVKKQKWVHGAALGVKDGLILVACLEKAPELRMLGMDIWDSELNEEGVSIYEKKCRVNCEPFAKRALLLKGEFSTIAKGFRTHTFDFAVYNCYDSNLEYQEKVLEIWATKLKPGGYLLSEDIDHEDVQGILSKVGFGKIAPVVVNGKESETLKYAKLN